MSNNGRTDTNLEQAVRQAEADLNKNVTKLTDHMSTADTKSAERVGGGHTDAKRKKKKASPGDETAKQHREKREEQFPEKKDRQKKSEKPGDKQVGDPQKKRKKKPQTTSKKVERSDKTAKAGASDLDHDELFMSDDLDGFTKSNKKGKSGKKDKKKGMGKGLKIFLITTASIIGTVALVYLGAAVFFMSHFYYNTKINGVDFSMKSAEDVENYMKTQVNGYVLTIQEKQNVEEQISGEEISLEYQESDEIKQALEKQNAFLWPKAFFEPDSAEVKINVAYDEAVLNEKIQALKCISEVEQTEPQSAYPKFNGEQFVVEPEVTGMKVDQEIMKQKVNDYISGFQDVLNMEEEGCYMLPKYTSESPEVQAACDAMNNYCKASITYTMGSVNEVVDKALISTWVVCDSELNVAFNTEAVKQYMAEFGKKYDTVGKTRTITTPGGKNAEVSGGTYGWSVDEAAETSALINSIQNGEVVTKEPAYVQTAASHDGADWGNTYIEVDLSAQHMWYVSNGSVAFETDVVTGLPTPARQTPAGVYNILEKLRNKTLRGDRRPDGSYEYETPVSYWMRVTYSGIGFHDATWQPYFGGSRYQTNGSHGCINMSYSDAATLYDSISVGVPVIMHY